MLRVRFTAEDLLGTRFAPEPAPLMELGLALATLQGRDVLFDRWRRQARAGLPRGSRPLFELVPPSGAGPVFLDPISDGLEDGLDTVSSTPAPFAGAELRRVVAHRRPTPWVRALEDRDRDAWVVLDAALRAAYRAVLAETWPRVRACYRAEVAMHARSWARDGVRAVLTAVHPGTGWDGSTLNIPVESRSGVDVGGTGVTLMPSVMWRGRPLFCRHPDGSLLIVYAAATPLPLAGGSLADDSLSALLGSTRAALLALTAAGRTTSELASAAGISIASASEHAKVLRAAGLISSLRDGRAVLHTLAPLGEQLLLAG